MKTDAVAQVVGPVVTSHGLEIDRIEAAAAGKRTVLRVFLDGDGPAGHGPSLDQIADATRSISDALDASTITGDRPYVLEVSSRGVGRPLTEPKHYRRNVGRLLAVTPADGPALEGRIVEADADGVTLDVDGADMVVPYAHIVKAVVRAELTKGGDDLDDAAEFAADDDFDEQE